MNRNILLISPQRDLDIIGLKILHYHLLANNWNSALLFIPNQLSQKDNKTFDEAITDFLKSFSPLFIGISLMSGEYHHAKNIAGIIKKNFPAIPIICGGIHPTIAPDTCFDFADFVCIGEGENTLLEIAERLSSGCNISDIKNLCFKKDSQIIKNPMHPLIEDVGKIASYEHFPVKSYIFSENGIIKLDLPRFRKYSRYNGTNLSVITSRGCPLSCAYCCNNALFAIYGIRKIRFREIKDVIDELKKAVSDFPFIEYINIQDDCFLARPEKELEKFCDEYKKHVKKPFILRSIPAFITGNKTKMLKSAGAAWISIGLQSGSDKVCADIYKRKLTKADFLKAAAVINKYEIAAIYDVILDNPFENDAQRLETAETFIETPKPFYSQFFSLCFYPGTELQKKAIEEHIISENEYMVKDYHLYTKTTLNNLIRLSAFLPASYMRYLVGLYKNNPSSFTFKITFFLGRMLNTFILEPFTYLRVIRLSQNKNILKTIGVLRFYVKEGLTRFLKQFK